MPSRNTVNFKKSLKALVTFDKIRIYKLIEMFQYVIVFLTIGIPATTGISHLFHNTPDEIKQKTRLQIYSEFALLCFILVVTLFYIVKISKVIPSIMGLVDRDFVQYTTFEYSVKIVLIVALLKLNHTFITYITHIKDNLLNYE